MSTLLQTSPRNPFGSSIDRSTRPRSMAILPQNPSSPKSSPGDPMQLTSPPPSMSMAPPTNSSPETEQGRNGIHENRDQSTTPVNHSSSAAAAAAAAAVGASQGPKVVQTAFIHKLYSMLEDRSIQHLISWSHSNESFVMSPSNEFSKVLAQYFKHTNISSFVRQLNMYGFHKVSDVFHTGNPESALWEFKHGNGNFRKGDLMGLREIKRRASKHTLIHRDSFSAAKPGPSQPGTPADIIPDTEQRLASLEHAYYEMHSRLSRTEESYALMSSRYQALTEGLVKCHQWSHALASAVQSLTPSESHLHADMSSMQKDIARQLEFVRGLEMPPELLMNGRPPYFPPHTALEPPLSPRGYGYPDSRRSSVQIEPQHVGLRPPVPPIPPQFAAASSPRRLGSIGGAQPSPGFSRPALPPQPPSSVHPLASVVNQPNLARRHTSADIREHGWPPNANGSPYTSGQSSVQWQPSSPHHTPHTGDQQIREQLAQYDISGPRRQTITATQRTPPMPSDHPPSGLGVDNVSWSLGGSKFPRPNFELHSAPPTRRSSMASNVHSLLNPPDPMERGEENDGVNDDRKRKRLQ